MRKTLIAAALVALISSPVHAGTYSVDANGQLSWQPSRCVPPPQPPPSLLQADRNTAAEDMNERVQQYNIYVGLAQAYMDCVNTEAEEDASTAGQSVVGAGQAVIADMKNNLDKLRAAAGAKSD